jgi:acyl-homoserine lactone acylase PvdQ
MIRILAFLVSAAVCAAAFAQGGAMSWPSVRGQIEAHWKKTYPTEKIQKIEPKGKLEYYATERRTEVDFSWGWVWDSRVIERNGAFARQVALVTVERANKTQTRFEVAALFERMGNAWQSKGVAVRASQDLSAAKAGDLPTNAQAAAIFTEAWKKQRPDFDVHSVEVLKSEPKQYQDRRWIVYKLAITATGTDKGSREMYRKKYRCTPGEESSVLKLEGSNWVADAKMIEYINESTQCSLAK